MLLGFKNMLPGFKKYAIRPCIMLPALKICCLDLKDAVRIYNMLPGLTISCVVYLSYAVRLYNMLPGLTISSIDYLSYADLSVSS